MEVPIKTTGLSKRFNGIDAVKSTELTIEAGQVYGLLGRNGAGKTTLLRMLLGILKPNKGQAFIFGKNFASADETLRQRVAYIGQDYRFYNSYTLAELVNILSPLYPKWNWDKADHLLEVFELKKGKRLGEMSGGQRQKVAMLVAFSCGAELLILDEPASALDPISRRLAMGEMMSFMSDNPERNSIIFSTHIVNDLERVATKVGMMNNGEITHEFELDTIHESMRKVQIFFPNRGLKAAKPQASISHSVERNVISAVYDLSKIESQVELAEFKKEGATIKEMSLNLEEFFIEVYGQSSLVELA